MDPHHRIIYTLDWLNNNIQSDLPTTKLHISGFNINHKYFKWQVALKNILNIEQLYHSNL